MRAVITGDRLTSLFRPRRVALVGASDKSTFSGNAYENLVGFGFGFGDRTYLVNTEAPANDENLTVSRLRRSHHVTARDSHQHPSEREIADFVRCSFGSACMVGPRRCGSSAWS